MASRFAVGGPGGDLVAEVSAVVPSGASGSSGPEAAGADVGGVAGVSDVSGAASSPSDAGVTASEVLFELSLLALAEERRWAALGLRALAGFATARAAEPDPAAAGGRSGRLPEDYLAEEVGCAVALSPGEARVFLGDAVELCGRLPATVDALEAGALDVARVRAMVAVTGPMGDEQAGEVEQRVLARGVRSSRRGFRQAVRRAADRVDPEAPAQRARRRLERRDVRKSRQVDGVVEVGASLPAEVGEAVVRRVADLARHAKAPDDSRTPGQVRADVFAALLLGANTGDLAANEGRTVPTEVLVTVAATTLAGLDEEPGELSGYGAVPAEVARKLAEYGHWRRVLFDPVNGTVLDVGNRRHPTDALRRFVRTRDRTCRFPGCPTPAELSDIDHTTQHSEHGPTKDTNLGVACRRHHRMKDEESGWALIQTASGHFTWTSPVGRAYDVRPDNPWTADLGSDGRGQVSSDGGGAGWDGGADSSVGGTGDRGASGDAGGDRGASGDAGDRGGGSADPAGFTDRGGAPGAPPF